MRVSKRILKGLNNLKSVGKIRDFEVVVGGVILKLNNGFSIISKNIAELETNLAQICSEEE